MGSSLKYRGGLALALALACLGLLAPAAPAALHPYTLNETLSLTGDCSSSEHDEVPDPDCAGEPPKYPTPPNGPTGRFNRAFSVAIDEWGNLYVASRAEGTAGRIDIFDPEGHFISEMADQEGPLSIAVDSEGNLYAYEVGAVSGQAEVVRYAPDLYNPAAGEIEYDPGDRTLVTTDLSIIRNSITIDRADDHLYIARNLRLLEFSAAGEGNSLVETIEPEGPESEELHFATSIAIDAQRRLLYTSTCDSTGAQCVVWVLDADTHEFIEEIDGADTAAGEFDSGQGSIALAVDEANGHLFVGDLRSTDDIYEFDAEDEYSLVSEFEVPVGDLSNLAQAAVANNPEAPDPEDLKPGDNYRHLFVPVPFPSGSALAFAPALTTAPIVKDAAAAGIASTEAELEALIHPGQLETSYEIEYVSEAQFEVDEWASATTAGSGTLAGDKFQRVTAPLSGLSPGTAYRFRVRAENEAGEAEPPGEGTFTTYDDAPISNECPNQTLRSGLSAALPDCRAYELVTPADTNGGPPLGTGFEGDRFPTVNARPDGEGVSFELIGGALPGTEASGGFHGDPYLSSRTASGWSTALAGPTGAEASKPVPGSLSPDLGYTFWLAEGTGTAVIPGLAAHYVRYPDGHSELLARGSLGEDPIGVGRLIAEGGTHIVFASSEKLEPDAPEGIAAVYDRTADEVTHVVSLLPGDITPAQAAAYLGASPEGEGIAFRIGDTLYLRKENKTTYKVAEGLSFEPEPEPEDFVIEGLAGVSTGGERVFYLKEGNLEAYDTTSEDTITFADTAAPVIPVIVAPQGNRAYFVSASVIPGSGTNQADEEAADGARNLYLSEGEGTPVFIATLTDRDVEGVLDKGSGARLDGVGLWTWALDDRRPGLDPSRTSSDGGVLVFQARGDLSGYDSGEERQIYRYEAADKGLACLSCPPTATAPTGGALLFSISSLDGRAPFSPYGYVPNLAADGERVFFESVEALVSGDTDNRRDVYEWEEEGLGSCGRPGGCVYLISSGRSSEDNYLFGHSASGEDVFFSTTDVLLAGDEATLSIYDARVGGGFATAPSAPCQGEECRPVITPPPALPVPQSGAQGGSGNVRPARRCPRGKRAVRRRGRTVCVRKHKKKHRAAKRRASR